MVDMEDNNELIKKKNMDIIHGSIDNGYIECINPKLKKYRVRWNFTPYINEYGEEQGKRNGSLLYNCVI